MCLQLAPHAVVITKIRLRFDGHSTAYQKSQWSNPLAAVTLTYWLIYLFRPQCNRHTEIGLLLQCRSLNGRSAVELQSNGSRTAVESQSNRSCIQRINVGNVSCRMKLCWRLHVDRQGEPEVRRGDVERRVFVAWSTTRQHLVSGGRLHRAGPRAAARLSLQQRLQSEDLPPAVSDHPGTHRTCAPALAIKWLLHET